MGLGDPKALKHAFIAVRREGIAVPTTVLKFVVARSLQVAVERAQWDEYSELNVWTEKEAY